MEISAIPTERLGNDSLQFSSNTNLKITSSRNFDMEQQPQQQQQDTGIKQKQTTSGGSSSGNCNAVHTAKGNSTSNNTSNLNNNDNLKDDESESQSSLADIVIETLKSLLDRIDSDHYPIVTATTSQSLIYDSCTKVSIISPVKDEDLNKTNDIVMLRNLEITPPPHATPSPNLNKDIQDAATSNTARKRRASQRTQSEQSDESSSTTTGGRSKRQRKQTELFQVQAESKKTTTTNSSSRKSKPEPKPQIRQEESKFQDVIFYEKGDHLSIRSEEGTFYLCQLTENVRVQRPFVKVRWLDTEDGGKTYFLTSHYDKVPQKSIIMPVNLEKLKADKKNKQQYTIDDQIKNTIVDRLKRSMNSIPAED